MGWADDRMFCLNKSRRSSAQYRTPRRNSPFSRTTTETPTVGIRVVQRSVAITQMAQSFKKSLMFDVDQLGVPLPVRYLIYVMNYSVDRPEVRRACHGE
jgi:hypothetical protein